MEWIDITVYGAIAFIGLSLLFFYQLISRQVDLREKMGGDWAKQKEVAPHWQEKTMRIMIRWSKDLVSLGERFPFFSNSEMLETDLMKAGRPFHFRVQDIHGLKMLLALMGFVFGILAMVPLFFLGLANLAIFPLVGYFLPLLWLKKAGEHRQSEISREMPDFLDITSITLGAGLSLDRSLERYVMSIHGPLSEEIGLYNDEIRLGVSRAQALMNLNLRTSNPDMEYLVNDLLQALRLGVPFAETFRQQAEGMRKLREERAKTMAEKAGPKTAVVISVVITPAILIFIMGVLALNLMGVSQ